MNISAQQFDFRELNRKIRSSNEDIHIKDCYGQRFIGSGLKERKIFIYGTPGNALGAYLDGGEIQVYGNVQDAVGDTMNDGKIIINGSAGDALGYAMRGGSIFVRGDSGYRTGIHMKEFENKKPVIVVGGCVGSFLGEYLAGGIIIVLNVENNDFPVGKFSGTGMHGGKIFVRTNNKPKALPAQVAAAAVSSEDLKEIFPYLKEFSEHFGFELSQIVNSEFYVLRPNAKNPYKQLYVAN